MRGWADVGLWVAVCFLAKLSSNRPTCKTTFARLTQSQAISQSFRVFITFRSMRDTTFFSFSKLFFIQNYGFLYHVIKTSPSGESAGGGQSTIQSYLKDPAWSRIHQAWGPSLKAPSVWRPGPKAWWIRDHAEVWRNDLSSYGHLEMFLSFATRTSNTLRKIGNEHLQKVRLHKE